MRWNRRPGSEKITRVAREDTARIRDMALVAAAALVSSGKGS